MMKTQHIGGVNVMSTLQQLETTLDQWYKKSPIHLPESARKWIGDNVWWIVIIGVIASVISVVGSIRALFWADDLLKQTREFAASIGVTVPNDNLAYDISLWVSAIVFIIVILIELRAIQPLREKKKHGWDLVFLAALLSLAGGLVSGLISGAVVGPIVGTIVGAVIGGFFLFETRSQFLPAAKQSHGKSSPATHASTKTPEEDQ